MAEIRRIEMFVFVMLLLLLEFTASEDVSYMFVREGDEVTLPCKNVRDDQDRCKGTTWTFNEKRNRAGVELIQLGQIGRNAQDKSDRLNVTGNCSLVIKKVKVQDAAHYFCRQYDKDGQERGPSSPVDLSVVSLTEKSPDGDDATLTCSVSTYEDCKVQVKWTYNDIEVDKDHPDIDVSKSSCSETVTFKKTSFLYTSNVQLLKCSVRQDKVQQYFPFRRPSSAEEPDKDTKTTKNTNTASGTKTPGIEELWWIIVVVLVLVAAMVTVVVFIRRKRSKGKKTRTYHDVGLTSNLTVMQPSPETGQDVADPEDGVSYASISYKKKTDGEARLHSEDRDDAVTYSTVKASSSSSSAAAAASSDPSVLYANVNK